MMRSTQTGIAAASSSHMTVVGSINVDNVLQLDRLPTPGETVAARSLEQLPGGKVRSLRGSRKHRMRCDQRIQLIHEGLLQTCRGPTKQQQLPCWATQQPWSGRLALTVEQTSCAATFSSAA